MCGKKDAQFRSVEYQKVVHASTMGEGYHVIILPTGSGKSLMFGIPALLNCDKVSILIVFVVALNQDILRLCHHWSLDAATWERRYAFGTRIVVASVEHVEHDIYRSFVS